MRADFGMLNLYLVATSTCHTTNVVLSMWLAINPPIDDTLLWSLPKKSQFSSQICYFWRDYYASQLIFSPIIPPQPLPSVPIFSSLSFDQDLCWPPPWHRSPPVTLTSGGNISVLGQILAMCHHPMVSHCPNLDHCHLLCHLVLTPSPVVQPLATSAAANLAVLHPFEPTLVLMIFYIVRFAISILTQLVQPSRL